MEGKGGDVWSEGKEALKQEYKEKGGERGKCDNERKIVLRKHNRKERVRGGRMVKRRTRSKEQKREGKSKTTNKIGQKEEQGG